MEPDILFVLLLGFFAGFVDSIAGGGGLIALPGLLGLGLPPHIALGTNKLQSIFGTITASINYFTRKEVKLSSLYFGIVFTFIGAVAGTVCILFVHPGMLRWIIPIALSFVFFYLLFRGKIFDLNRPAKMKRGLFFVFFGLGLGFYDGFFGPGVGSFWMFSLLFFLGLKMIPALTCTKVFNVTSNFASILIFAHSGSIHYQYAFLMGATQILCSNLGARLALKKGTKLIRPFLMVLVFFTLFKTILDLVGVKIFP